MLAIIALTNLQAITSLSTPLHADIFKEYSVDRHCFRPSQAKIFRARSYSLPPRQLSVCAAKRQRPAAIVAGPRPARPSAPKW